MNNTYPRQYDEFCPPKCIEYDFGCIINQEVTSLGLEFGLQLCEIKEPQSLQLKPDKKGTYLVIALLGNMRIGTEIHLKKWDVTIIKLPAQRNTMDISKGRNIYLAITIDSIMPKLKNHKNIEELSKGKHTSKIETLGIVENDFRLIALAHLILNTSKITGQRVSLYRAAMTLATCYLMLLTNDANDQYQVEKTILSFLQKPFKAMQLQPWQELRDLVSESPQAEITRRYGYLHELSFEKEFRKHFSYSPAMFQWPAEQTA